MDDYFTFRENFLLNVHEQDLTVTAKLALLKASIEERAGLRTFMNSLPPGKEGYKALIKRLEDKYGNEEHLLNHHLAKSRQERFCKSI